MACSCPTLYAIHALDLARRTLRQVVQKAACLASISCPVLAECRFGNSRVRRRECTPSRMNSYSARPFVSVSYLLFTVYRGTERGDLHPRNPVARLQSQGTAMTFREHCEKCQRANIWTLQTLHAEGRWRTYLSSGVTGSRIVEMRRMGCAVSAPIGSGTEHQSRVYSWW